MTCQSVWFPLWIGDYIADTTHLSCEQHGAYFLLMLAYYKRGRALPDDDAFLASVAKSPRRSWRYLRPVLVEFFRVEGGLWHHKRIDAEMAEQVARAEVRSRAGSVNARKRWQQGHSDDNPIKSTADDMPPVCQSHANGSQSPSRYGYSEDNSTKSTIEAMPTVCQSHKPKNRHSKSQKKLAITNLSWLLDPKANKINGPNMLQSQGRSLCPQEAERDLPTHARASSPPLPSRGDGVAATRAPTHRPSPDPPTVFDDPELRAYGDAAFERCLDALHGKRRAINPEAQAAT